MPYKSKDDERARKKRQRARNPEKYRKYLRLYRARNRERIREYEREKRSRTRPMRAAQYARWKVNNPEQAMHLKAKAMIAESVGVRSRDVPDALAAAKAAQIRVKRLLKQIAG